MNVKNFFSAIIGIVVALTLGWIVSEKYVLQEQEVAEVQEDNAVVQVATNREQVFPNIDIENIPEDHPMRDEILYGYNLVNETHVYAEEKVGANLSCGSCHANAGLDDNVAPLVGVMADYPKYMPRPDDIVTIEERINGCMIRSMNGEPFEDGSKELKSMVAYLKYISEDVIIGEPRPWAASADMKKVPTPNVENGEQLYQQSCIACHAADGAGIGANVGPALWGDTSFNDGAGLARMSKMAGYIQEYMPVGQEMTLTDQEASDLAAYILIQARPEFAHHDKDWANGAPSDIMTKERREQGRNGTLDWEEVLADYQ